MGLRHRSLASGRVIAGGRARGVGWGGGGREVSRARRAPPPSITALPSRPPTHMRDTRRWQLEKWLPRACSGEHIGGMGMSEPSCGTDVLAMRTTAQPPVGVGEAGHAHVPRAPQLGACRRGQGTPLAGRTHRATPPPTTQARAQPDGSFKLNGTKMWITNGAVNDTDTGDVFLVCARRLRRRPRDAGRLPRSVAAWREARVTHAPRPRHRLRRIALWWPSVHPASTPPPPPPCTPLPVAPTRPHHPRRAQVRAHRRSRREAIPSRLSLCGRARHAWLLPRAAAQRQVSARRVRVGREGLSRA